MRVGIEFGVPLTFKETKLQNKPSVDKLKLDGSGQNQIYENSSLDKKRLSVVFWKSKSACVELNSYSEGDDTSKLTFLYAIKYCFFALLFL